MWAFVINYHPMDKLEKEEIITALIKGFREAREFTGPDLKEMRINGIDDKITDRT